MAAIDGACSTTVGRSARPSRRSPAGPAGHSSREQLRARPITVSRETVPPTTKTPVPPLVGHGSRATLDGVSRRHRLGVSHESASMERCAIDAAPPGRASGRDLGCETCSREPLAPSGVPSAGIGSRRGANRLGSPSTAPRRVVSPRTRRTGTVSRESGHDPRGRDLGRRGSGAGTASLTVSRETLSPPTGRGLGRGANGSDATASGTVSRETLPAMDPARAVGRHG